MFVHEKRSEEMNEMHAYSTHESGLMRRLRSSARDVVD